MFLISDHIKRISNFIRNDMWRIRRAKLPPGKSFFLTLLRVLALSLRGFDEDKCQLRASALTFYSLISIVPVAAMAFGIAKGFGIDRYLERELRLKFAGQEQVLDKVLVFSRSLLESTRGELIAGVGLLLLFWAVIKMLGQIEDSLNEIWGVREQRSLGRKFSDYLSFVFICPVILIVSSSMTIFITTQITVILDKIAILGALSHFVLFLLRLLPYSLIWGLFTFVYIFMPNTRVRFSSALLAGIIGGTIFEIVQWLYITFQVGVAQYNAVYGSFAALPLFLVWLQLSWLILLYGAELSFAYQNVDTYEFEPDALQASHRLKTLLSLHIARFVVARFVKAETPPNASRISQDLEIPIRLVNEIIFALEKSQIISAVDSGKDRERGFIPSRDIHTLTVQYIIEALEKDGLNNMSFAHTPEFDSLADTLAGFDHSLERLPANKLIKDL